MINLYNEPKNPLVYYVKNGILYKFGTDIDDADECAIVKVYKNVDGTFHDEAKTEPISVTDDGKTKKYYLDKFISIGDVYNNGKFEHITHGSSDTQEKLPDYFKRICKESIIKNIGDRYNIIISKAENYKSICKNNQDDSKFDVKKIEELLGVPYWMIKDVKTGISVSGCTTIPLTKEDYDSYLDEYCTNKLIEYANTLKETYDVTEICAKKNQDGTCGCMA